MKPLTSFENWYGRDEPPPEIIKIKAGCLDLDYQEGDLRYIRCGDQELIRRIYVAIRDVNWNTIPGRISNLSIHTSEDQFNIQFDVLHKDKSIEFSWHASIIGSSDGIIEYSMSGVANQDFRYCRIGFCVLHPIKGVAGSVYHAVTPTGSLSGVIPDLITPQTIKDGFELPIFPASSSITVDLPDNLKITTDFEGDLFEMEDQRNWTDGSFKTYCTPLSLGYPHLAKSNQSFYQKVTVKTQKNTNYDAIKTPEDITSVQLSIDEETSRQLPKIGFGLTRNGEDFQKREIGLISNLHPDHLKIELHFNDPSWPECLAMALKVSKQICSPLEIALFLNNDLTCALDQLKARFLVGQISRIIVFNEDESALGTTSPHWMERVRMSLSEVISDTMLVGGTNGNFAELNRQQPELSFMDGVAYTINPQVHLTDERSLVEALEAQHDTVVTASKFCGTLPISISSVTLKPPFNQAATEIEMAPDFRELPPSVDPRQMSLFASAWTVGSIHSLALGGADSITYFETTGWRGLMETMEGSSLPEKFHSQPGMLYPIYYIFEFLAQVKGASFYPMKISHPLKVQGFGCRKNNLIRFLFCNLQPNLQEIRISSLPNGRGLVRRLHNGSMALATQDPEGFLRSSEPIIIESGQVGHVFEPYETVFLEINQ